MFTCDHRCLHLIMRLYGKKIKNFSTTIVAVKNMKRTMKKMKATKATDHEEDEEPIS